MPAHNAPAPRAIIIYGPTASGKTDLALRLAAAHGKATIINADSMQVYHSMPILTACPTESEMAQVPHRLFAYLDPATACSVGMWLEAVRIAIYETWQNERLPIIVGGTGMYVKSLIDGIAPIPDIPQSVRDAVRALSVEDAYAELQTKDSAMAEKLEAGDSQRIARALEVFEATGKPLSEWQKLPLEKPIPEGNFQLFALNLDRDLLYERCNLRLENMLDAGALEELQSVLDRNLSPDLPAMRAVGVPELAKHLRGEWSRGEALSKAQQATRNYAKRQLTWLRQQFPNAELLDYPYQPIPDSLLRAAHISSAKDV